MYVSPISAKCPIISNSNYRSYIDCTINGNRMGRGYIPRNFAQEPRGSSPYSTKVTLPRWSRQEIKERIEESERKKTTLVDLCDFYKLGVKNQGQLSYCHSADTEVLTENGWVLWSEYNGVDKLATVNQHSQKLEYQTPTHFHIFDYEGEIYRSSSNRIDFAITPNHRMYVRKWDESKRKLSNEYSFTTMDKLGWYSGLMSSPSGFDGVEINDQTFDNITYSGNDFVKLISLVCSDGFAGGSPKSWNTVSFACFKSGERYEEIKLLAERTGFKEQPNRKGVFSKHSLAELANWIRENCYISTDLGAVNKKIPNIILNSTEEQIRLFLDIFGDQSHTITSGRQYFSSSKLMIDQLQELCLKINKRGKISSEEPKDNGFIKSNFTKYILNVAETDNLSIEKKKQIYTENYSGKVYCATVPNSTLITRYDGTILISGNCWVYAVTHCVEIARLKQNPNKKIVLSPESVGGPITGYKNVGGWANTAIDYGVKNGWATEQSWPAYQLNSRLNTPAVAEERKKYKIQEYWELEFGNFEQLCICLLLGYPVAIGLSWWRHEVTCMKPIINSNGGLGCVIDNSWGTSWGDKGRGVLTEDRLKGDMYAPRVMIS